MRTDDVLGQIDAALDDWDVSGDAMRWAPAREPATPQVAVVDEAGEWQEVEGVVSVDIRFEPLPVDPEFARRWQEMWQYIARVQAERERHAVALLDAFRQGFEQTVAPAIQEAARNTAQGLDSVKSAVDCDVHCKPPRPRDRPAWQSPYGPAPRRIR